MAGNGLPDTVLTFRTINMDTLSEIIGTVFDRDTTAEGELVVTATQIKNTEISYSTILSQPGPYRIDSVLPGMYLLDVFRDKNGDRCYTTGAPYPFIPSERFIVYEDTVKIRSRWPNEGNNLKLP
jgi:hypothetical protein